MTETNEKAITNVTAYPNTYMNDKQKNTTNQAETDFLPDVEPWPEPINGAELADDLVNTIKKYVYLPDGASEVIAIWMLHTYLSHEYTFTPRLFVHSPEPRCGKTTLLDILGHLSYKPLQVSSITGPSMARMITLQKGQITLLADEADRYLNNDNDTLCKVLNSGFQRGKKIMCTETSGRSMKPQLFDCFAPCAIAAIGNIPTTVKDRSLTITMKRKTSADKIEKLRYRQVCQSMEELRQRCKRFIMDNEQQIIDLSPDVPDVLNDRTADVSEILFAIAQTISPQWYTKFKDAVLKLVKADSANDDPSVRVQLLTDIREIFANVPRGWLSSNDLVEKLNDIETSPWSEWNHGRPMTPSALARQLKYFGIVPIQKREGGDERSRKYYVKYFEDAFNRYIPVSSCDTVTTGTNADVDCHTVTTQFNDNDLDDLPDMGF